MFTMRKVKERKEERTYMYTTDFHVVDKTFVLRHSCSYLRILCSEHHVFLLVSTSGRQSIQRLDNDSDDLGSDDERILVMHM